MLLLPLSLTPVMAPGQNPGSENCNWELTLKLYRISCCNWMRLSLWIPMGFMPGYWKSWLVLLRISLSYLWTVLGIWSSPSQLESSYLFQISGKRKHKKEDHGYYRPVSPTWMRDKIMEIIILGTLKNTWKTMQWKPKWVHEGKVMFLT